MYSKLAWRNIRRSLRDYGIYFLTLVFAVAIFYVFNSLADQPAFLALQGNTRRMAQGALSSMQWLTVIMTGVVLLLVLYANRVIIKKRNRELGTYLLLGMEQGRLALLLLAEITVIGMAALLVGLVSGIFLSQFFALVVNRILAAGLAGHPFVFSPVAAVRTLLCYGLAFLLVGLWQAAAVYRQKLIDLIIGVQQNEEMRVRSRSLSLVAGAMTVLTVGSAYWLSDRVSRDPAINPGEPRIWIGGLLGVVGTYLLFAALAGLFTAVRRHQSRWMARGLNLFLYRQLTSKINTHATMLATITLMLTFTICAMSFGLGLGQGIGNRADQDAPFDYMFFSLSPAEAFQWVPPVFEQHGAPPRQMIRFVTAVTSLQIKRLMLPEDAVWFGHNGGMAEYLAERSVEILPVSVYQELRALKGYSKVELPTDRFLIHASAADAAPQERARQAFGRFLARDAAVTLGGRALRPASTEVFTDPLGSQLGSGAMLVVPDSVASSLPGHHSYMVVQLNGQASAELDDAVTQATMDASRHSVHNRSIGVTSRSELMGASFVTEGMLVFLSFYIGVMFILISATLLSLQQVTDAVEHRQRFQVLRKLGADELMIDGTIARQLGLYFLTPVAVALLHSLVAMTALARLFKSVGGYTTFWAATLATLGIFALIYGAYYLLSLQSCRTLFREPQPR